MTRVKIRKIGNSLGFVVPAEDLAQHRVKEGDELILTRTPDGYRLAVYDPDVAEQVKAGQDIAHKYRDTLRELAK